MSEIFVLDAKAHTHTEHQTAKHRAIHRQQFVQSLPLRCSSLQQRSGRDQCDHRGPSGGQRRRRRGGTVAAVLEALAHRLQVIVVVRLVARDALVRLHPAARANRALQVAFLDCTPDIVEHVGFNCVIRFGGRVLIVRFEADRPGDCEHKYNGMAPTRNIESIRRHGVCEVRMRQRLEH